MATELQDTLERIAGKCELLLERHNAARAEIAKVSADNARLNADNEQLRKHNEQLRVENEYLRLARNVASTPAQIEQSRAMISRLVLDIDKCIAQLAE